MLTTQLIYDDLLIFMCYPVSGLLTGERNNMAHDNVEKDTTGNRWIPLAEAVQMMEGLRPIVERKIKQAALELPEQERALKYREVPSIQREEALSGSPMIPQVSQEFLGELVIRDVIAPKNPDWKTHKGKHTEQLAVQAGLADSVRRP